MLDGSAVKEVRRSSEPMWKRRLDTKIAELRKEADIFKAHIENRIKSEKAKAFLNKVLQKYRCDGSRPAVMKILYQVKEKISLTGCKIRRYLKSIKSREQNETFSQDKKRFYRSVFEEENVVKEPPKAEEIREFWGGKIWGDSSKYKEQPSWYAEVKRNYKNVSEQEWKGISEEEICTQLSRSMNWKAPGIDCLSNFWLKNMPCCFKLLASSMNA